MVKEGGGEIEDLLQDLEGKGCRWDSSCLARFSKFLGFSTEGFEGEILNLLLGPREEESRILRKIFRDPLSLIVN